MYDPEDEDDDWLEDRYDSDYGEEYPYGYEGSRYGDYDLEDRF